MVRKPRADGPGKWFHVVNRGVSRRSVFENRADVEFFLDGVRDVVERGWLEVHAYAVADDPLSLSRPQSGCGAVSGDASRSAALRPDTSIGPVGGTGLCCAAGLARSTWTRFATGLPSSATSTPTRPRRASRGVRPTIRSVAQPHTCRVAVRNGSAVTGSTTNSGSAQARSHRREQRMQMCSRVGSRMPSARSWSAGWRWPDAANDPIDELMRGGALALREWFHKKALLADGTKPGLPIAAPEEIQRALAVELPAAIEPVVKHLRQGSRRLARGAHSAASA